jgi:hypothetical protein
MAEMRLRTVLGALGGSAVLLVLAAFVWLPRLVYPPLSSHDLGHLADQEKRVELQQSQSQLQNEFRGQLLQGLGGLVVVAGAAAGWQQLRLAREGQITERFTRAIDHLGSDTLDVRLGGIYALERVAKNSPPDRPTVTYILGAFVREHAPWPVGAPDGPQHPTPVVDDQMPWLTSRAPDVQTALQVLSRRPAHREEQTLYLSRVDLRRARLTRARLNDVNLRHTNLARAWMAGIHLERSQLANADLRYAHLQGAQMAHAELNGAHLEGADLRQASLRGADLRGANLTDALLDGTDLNDVRTDEATVWPDAHRPA